MFQKKKRIEDKKLLKEVTGHKCCINRCFRKSVPCHVKSRGSGGDDVPENIIPMCGVHHTEQHTVGWNKFKELHPEVVTWDVYKLRLIEMGAMDA